MARKTAKPAWFVLTISNEGKMLLAIKSDGPVAQVTPTFGATVSLHPDARPGAIAVTLCETAAWLVRDSLYAKGECRQAAAACLTYDLGESDWRDIQEDDEPPF